MTRRSCLAAFVLLSLITLPHALAKDERLVVHEWGTFTSLQDEQGRSIGGINSDDEALPAFVYTVPTVPQFGDADSQRQARMFQKGYPRAHADVTMRLETPVLYFHLPRELDAWPTAVNVTAEFHGGWLTQFYPRAVAVGPPAGNEVPHIAGDTVGRLTWDGLRLFAAGNHTGPATTSKVWLAPREVAGAADVVTPAGEAERYLFYRGVAHLDPPLSLARSSDGDSIEIRASAQRLLDAGPLKIPAMWFCDFRPDGTSAFRRLDPVTINAGRAGDVLGTAPARFAEADFGRDSLKKLRSDMRQALVADGLFADEADALLNTWEASYFKSWGTRLFFIVPRAWTDAVLPLSISEPADLNRVMVGRIDLITPEHRALLKQIASATGASATDAQAQREKSWKLYDQLGRFRNALVLDELSRRPTDALRTFVNTNDLMPAPR